MDRVFAGLICGCGGAILAVLVAASLLRLSILITNKLVGGPKSKPEPDAFSSGGIPEYDWDDWDDEYTDDAPRRRSRPKRRTGSVTECGLAKASAIVLLTALAFSLGFVVLSVIGEEFLGLRMWRDESKLVVAILDLPFAGLALVLALIALLSTTFWRAAMIAFIYFFVLLGFLLVVATVVFVVAAAVRF